VSRRSRRWPAGLGALAVLAGVAGGARLEAQEGSKTAPQTSPLGYIEMPPSEDGTWVLSSGPAHNWGTPAFIRHLILVAREWRRRHPDGPVLRLGDLSKADGSDHPPHKTHKDGLTADVFTSPKNVCHIDFEDQRLTLELAQLFHDYGARQILYNGDLVTEKVPVAQKYPKHDDHFHVVIDPNRVPPDGELLVLPEPDSREGAVIAGPRVDAEKKGLTLSWRVLGQARLKSWRLVFDDLSDDGPPLHDTGPLKTPRTSYELPLAIEHGARYRWRVELDVAVEKAEKPEKGAPEPPPPRPVGFGWQTVTTDLEPPVVEAVGPADEAAAPELPTVTWRYTKTGKPQASFRVELDLDQNHKKISATLGPFPGAGTSYSLASVPLKRGKKIHWRVVAADANGNEAATPWRVYKYERVLIGTGAGGAGAAETPPEKPAERTGTVTADSLNLRAGPGTDQAVKATLKRGTPVTIKGEPGADWLEVEAPGADGQPVRGFVSKRYVELDAAN